MERSLVSVQMADGHKDPAVAYNQPDHLGPGGAGLGQYLGSWYGRHASARIVAERIARQIERQRKMTLRSGKFYPKAGPKLLISVDNSIYIVLWTGRGTRCHANVRI